MAPSFRMLATLAAAASATKLVPGKSIHDDLMAQTTSGLLTGTINGTAPNVRQFLGIPFAEPPVGNLRFQPPVPYSSDGGPLDATAFGASCFQPLPSPGPSTSVYSLMPEFQNADPEESEDCLFLNVFTPLHPVAEDLPVLIWIHGGGFTSNSGNVPYQIPDQWIEKTQGHVVVTINYRLGIFGYPNAAAQPLNAGLLDQRLAVEWVRDNIAAFGGDASRMTLWGQSAGAWSVNYYGYAYPEDPIVARLIADSGGSSAFVDDPTHSNFTSVAVAGGCDEMEDDGEEAEMACMQGLEASTIRELYSNTTGVTFSPGVDGKTVFGNNTERAVQGLVAQIPAIVGTNSREGAGFVPLSSNGTVPTEEAINAASAIIVCPTFEEIENRLAGGLTTYRYEYAGNFSNVSPLPWIGALHSGELPLIFGTHFEYRGNSTEFEYAVSDEMQGLWLSFISSPPLDGGSAPPSPSFGSLTWPEYDDESQELVVEFAKNNRTAQIVTASLASPICG